MTDLPAFLSGFALSAALIVAIGAQNAFVLRQGLRREHVGPVVAFCALADVTLMAAGVAGLGALLDATPALTHALALGGAAFLGWYGLGALRRAWRPSAGLSGDPRGEALTLRAALLRTAGFTLLNPHVYLDTVLLVGAVGAAQPGGQGAFVGGAGLASALWFAALGYGARLLAPLFARPVAWRVLDGVVGVTMLALAAGLVAVAAG
ncbi:LysE/ArgO family amino acid transporter [Falsiroseomonas oryziterrae]|uniref:LysE/ArgO family amino acid transporter n=1 Tax=Falsiroseomonas oryziterrae TaxID=2911368 RepID=UPI001F2E4490|nr:LysE/ArgO family amino acid transporter [Roseomonas sp. NPKOSM-4]